MSPARFSESGFGSEIAVHPVEGLYFQNVLLPHPVWLTNLLVGFDRVEGRKG